MKLIIRILDWQTLYYRKKYIYIKYNKIGFYVSIFPLIHVSKYDSPFRTFKGYKLTF